MSELGEHLKELRKSRGLTREQLSAQINIPKESIVNYENGRKMPSYDAVIKFEKFYEVSIAYLSGELSENDYDFELGYSLLKSDELKESFEHFLVHIESLPEKNKSHAFDSLSLFIKAMSNSSLSGDSYARYLSLLGTLSAYLIQSGNYWAAKYKGEDISSFPVESSTYYDCIQSVIGKIERLYEDHFKPTDK